MLGSARSRVIQAAGNDKITRFPADDYTGLLLRDLLCRVEWWVFCLWSGWPELVQFCLGERSSAWDITRLGFAARWAITCGLRYPAGESILIGVYVVYLHARVMESSYIQREEMELKLLEIEIKKGKNSIFRNENPRRVQVLVSFLRFGEHHLSIVR